MYRLFILNIIVMVLTLPSSVNAEENPFSKLNVPVPQGASLEDPVEAKKNAAALLAKAEKGNAEAQAKIASIFYKGETQGYPQDYLKAYKWLKKSAEQGNPDAQAGLGLLYEKGHGAEQSLIKAHAWYNIAAANGNKSAIPSRSRLAKDMSRQEVQKAHQLARELFNKNK